MVLKRTFFILFTFSFFSLSLSAEENENFWRNTIQEVFSNSPNVQNIKNTYTSSLIYKKQFDYQWFPLFQIDFQQNFTKNRGDYTYVYNQYPSSEPLWLLSPNAYLSINQKLPGNGNIALSAGYGFSTIYNQKQFLQNPQLQLQLNQSLGRGAFGFTKNPDSLLINEQTIYAKNTFTKELLSELRNIIQLLQNIDFIHADENYNTALFNQYKAEYDTAVEKYSKGLQSNLETYYSQHQYTNAQNQLNEILHEKREILKELNLLLSDFEENNIEKYRDSLKNLLSSLVNIYSRDSISIENNLDSQIYFNTLNMQQFNYQISENNYAPVFYISSSLVPDSNIYYVYSDWATSLDQLKMSPYPVLFQTSVGLRINFETTKARKLRKELYSLQQETTQKDLENNINKQKKEFSLLKKQLDEATEYYEKLEAEIQTEDSFREKRKALFEQKLLTQNDFYQSETLYYLIYKDYISTFWEMIVCQIDLISLSPDQDQLLNLFLGENNW